MSEVVLDRVCDSLLAENNTCAGSNDLLCKLLQVLLLVVGECLHLLGCCDLDLCLGLGLLDLERLGNKSDLCVPDILWHTLVTACLVDHES